MLCFDERGARCACESPLETAEGTAWRRQWEFRCVGTRGTVPSLGRSGSLAVGLVMRMSMKRRWLEVRTRVEVGSEGSPGIWRGH